MKIRKELDDQYSRNSEVEWLFGVQCVARAQQSPICVRRGTREILQIVRELDYTLNLVAKELSLGNTYKVGVVIPHVRHTYFTKFINGMLDQAQRSAYNLLLLPSQYDKELELQYLKQLRGQAFDHLIFTSRSIDLETIASYAKYGNIVCLETVNHSQLSSVYVDRKPACREAFRWLKELGYQHLALISPVKTSEVPPIVWSGRLMMKSTARSMNR